MLRSNSYRSLSHGNAPWTVMPARGLQGVPAGMRTKRVTHSLTKRQRMAVSAAATILGLLCAWWLCGGGGGGGSAGGTAGHDSAARSAALPRRGGTQNAAAADQQHAEGAKSQQQQQAASDGGSGGGGGDGASKQQQPGGTTDGSVPQQGATASNDGSSSSASGSALPGKQQGQQQQQAVKAQQKPMLVAGMEDESQWFDKLSDQACRHAQLMRVCSHRGRVAAEGVAPGSLTAYSILMKAGVMCFDIDFAQTSDGHLLATHPDDLQAVVGGKLGGAAADPTAVTRVADNLTGAERFAVVDHSLAELRAAGADEERFPTADTLIKVFAALLEESGLLWKQGDQQQQQQQQQQDGTADQLAPQPDYEQLPVLLMDLKGPSYNEAAINNITAAAQAVGATAHVALFVSSQQQVHMVRNRTQWAGPLIHAFMDRQDPNPPVVAAALEPVALLGPSIKMSDQFFAAAGQLGKPVLAWTVDAPQMLHRALEANLNAVISNRPLAVRGVLLDWRDRCSERHPEQAEERRRQRQRRSLQQRQQQRRLLLGRRQAAAAAGGERQQLQQQEPELQQS